MIIKKTKIVATIGPATDSEKMLKKIFLAGVDVARLNFSHGNLEEKTSSIEKIRKIATQVKKQITIIADMPGPKLRLGDFDGLVKIRKGQSLSLGVKFADLPIGFDFSESVEPDQKIYLNDGLVELKIISVKKGLIYTKAMNSGWVSSRKGINLPDTILKGDTFTPEDEKNALFAIKHKVEFIAQSFVQSADDVYKVREILKKTKSPIRIIAKIEKPQAIANIEEIIIAADAIMIARGDLAIETSPAQVPLIQQKIILLARQYQKPVIVATQMLESMIENPRPTRAEASDVANAVLSQVDAVMLSAESVAGKYPLEAVSTMSAIIESVESDPDFRRYIKINWEKLNLGELNVNAIVASSASLAYRLKAPLIAVGTVSGKTAQQLSSFRPSALIVASTHDDYIARQLSLYWGVVPVVVAKTAYSEDFDDAMLKAIAQHKLCKKGSVIVLVWGSQIGVSGTTDTIKTSVV